jgi:hypothetical protein
MHRGIADFDFNSKLMDTLDIQESIKNIGKIGSLQVNIQGICLECEINDKTISNQQNKGDLT